VWHRSQRREGGWSPWSSLQGAFTGADLNDYPQVTRSKHDRLAVFAEFGGGPGPVWYCSQLEPGGDWSGWSRLYGPGNPPSDGIVIGNYVVGCHADGRLVVFLGGSEIWQRDQGGTGDWSEWRSFGLPAFPDRLADPTLVLNASGHVELWCHIEGTTDLFRLKQTSPNGDEWDGRKVKLQPPPISTGAEPAPH
jgi:hypothetical protein